MAIIKTEEGSFVISSRRMYLPGVFADERAARYAFQFTDATLHDLQLAANKRSDKVITMDDLKAARAYK